MQRVKVKVMPLTFVFSPSKHACDQEILVPLPRDGIFLLTSTLLLETSFPARVTSMPPLGATPIPTANSSLRSLPAVNCSSPSTTPS